MKYALKKVRKMTFRDIATGKNKATLTDLKTFTFTGSSEIVWADGNDGAHLVGFDVNKVAGATADNGSIDIGLLELQTGGTLTKVEGGNAILHSETLTVAGGKVKTNYKAAGTVGNEIGYIYPIDSTGDPDRQNTYAQGATASASVFSYDPETLEITLPTDKFNDGDKVYVEYFPKFKTYDELSNDTDKFSDTCAVYVDGWFTDICTKKDVPLQIVLPSGKVSGEINYQMGDQAAVQNVTIDATSTCGDRCLWKLYKYNMEDVSNE